MASRKNDAGVPEGKDSPQFERSDAIRLLASLSGVIAAYLLPLAAFLVARWMVSGNAEISYFEEAAQILPLLLLALVIEQRYLTRRWRPHGPAPLLADARGLIRAMAVFARFYAVVVLIYLAWGEADALSASARGSATVGELKTTTGALAAGFTALVVTALLGASASPGPEGHGARGGGE